ncbi:neuroligin-3-like [Ylistrum balloti]|uniref:neuroligin-3-like n=1 Tax=Ylistrum balloti TaxID=509963 RepID=UPI002905A345|nr:neuroligin-3-like [Ylistrum balloti]
MGFVNDSTGIGLAILLGFITFGIGNVFGTTVSTEDGAVEGIVVPLQKGNVYQFKKIPYAMPPVGPLRFSKPVKHPPWNNTLDATDFGPACIPSGSSTHPVSEDCLFLNVYIPHEVSTTTNKSVMVWIHGGGYIYGTGMDYDGASLAIHGDVIVVTINYRLGVFGFLSTGDSAARGNYGLWDQIEALKWIKSNIKYFGGNPDSITLFGESAGAFSVSHLAIFPENKGLFHRVIMQSGSLGSYGTITKDPVKIARSLGSYLQCSDIQNSESLVACLRRITASDLNQASDISHMYSIFRNTLGLSLGYSPVIDGEMILGDPMSIFKNQSSEHFKFYQSLDVISGCTSAEGSLMLIYISLFPGLSLPTIDISEGIPTSVLKMFAKPFIELYHNNDTRILEPIYAKYTSEDNEEQGRLLVNLLSDSQFYAPMLESLLVHDLNGNSKSKTFQYFFSKTSPIDGLIGVPPKWFEGAGHAAEIPYIFYNEYLDGSHKNLSTEMMSYWTNFARYG